MRTDSLVVRESPTSIIHPDLGFVESRHGSGEMRKAQQALATHSVFELRDLNVDLEDGESLVITGRVHCFYHKQLAQESVRPHVNAMRVVNRVKVVANRPR